MGKSFFRLEPKEESRLDIALLEAIRAVMPSLSRAELKDWFKAKRILLHDRPAAPAMALTPGKAYEIAVLDLEATTEAHAPAAEGSFLPIVFENDELLVLHKSSGTPSIPHRSNETETAVGSALAHFTGLRETGGKPLEPGLLHRLDTGTSGLLAFAKTASAYDRLRALWSSGKVKKTYRAIVPASPQLTVPQELGPLLAHDAKSARRMIVLTGRERPSSYRGKPLETLTRLVAIHGRSGSALDLEIEIQTGVMHQIRCTLASLGAPILGDSVYGGAPADRLYLHAWRLEIPLISGVSLTLEAALPPNWLAK